MYKDAEQKYRDKMIALRVSANIHKEYYYFEGKYISVAIMQMFLTSEDIFPTRQSSCVTAHAPRLVMTV